MLKQWEMTKNDLLNLKFPVLNFEEMWAELGAGAVVAKSVADKLRSFKRAKM